MHSSVDMNVDIAIIVPTISSVNGKFQILPNEAYNVADAGKKICVKYLSKS